MKQLLSLFIVIIFSSCARDSYKEQSKLYIATFENTIDIIDNESQKIYNIFKREIRDYFWGNPVKVRPWYNKSIKLKTNIEILINHLDSLQLTLRNNYSHNVDNFQFYEKEIKSLVLKANSLQDSVLSLINAKYEYNSHIVRSTKRYLDQKNWQSMLLRTHEHIEKVALLKKIECDIKLVEVNILRYLYSEIDASCFRFYKIEPIVIPQSEVIPLGKPYVANILIGTIDSTRAFEYEIGNGKYLANECKYTYKEKVTAKKGIVKRPGRFVFPQRYTGDSLIIPFTIEYEVLKEK